MESTPFSTLSLPTAMLDNLTDLGYTVMTPVQHQSLPAILQGQDVMAQGKTGSGKTVAFGIGVLYHLDVKRFRVQSLILCPTRELADQVAKTLRQLARYTHNVKVLTLCGGAPFGLQLGSLRHGAHIVVGTPGRVLKHLKQESLSLDALQTCVLDEADRMLDMGFTEAVHEILSYAPKQRQTLLFSATFEGVEGLDKEIQKDPVAIKTVEERHHITERFYPVASEQKLATLLGILSTYQPERSIVFCNTKLATQELADALHAKGVDALAIHGDLEQYERIDVLVQFANRSCSVLVATDVAARGLDIKALEAVLNYDMPQDPATYTHRIGRTGRAGEEGLAFSLVHSVEAMDIYGGGARCVESVETLHHDASFQLQPPNVTLVIEGGKKMKIRPGDLLGALTGEGGIEGAHVGKIDIYERQSYVAIARHQSERAYRHLKQGQIKGKTFPVWLLES